ncbi:glycoside hydrolase family 16 [Purpureocillium lavendulum]|uniref:Glycoside hydrolase family 16 n=1 Tax=Purpureocillium lavendulum TaxID=1247861 RepID=A0AB34FXS2_9HYPO|nr:glycoside hydrolase family 16 [Purpureocillium lavendulum]
MPWKDKLKQLKGEFDTLVSGGSQSHQQAPPPHQQQPGGYGYGYGPGPGPGSGPPPPVPPHPPQQTHPGQQQQPPAVPPHPPAADPVYWRPQFRPDLPVTAEWDAKLGNGPDGWGNQELEHYTASPDNAFHTPDGRLVIRAIARSGAPGPDQRYTSARLVSRQTLARDRGVLTGVIVSPCAAGIWPAFWLLPQEPFSWPTDGEIDIAETWNGDHENHTCLHWGQHHEPQKHRVLGTRIPDMHARPVRYDFAWDQPGGQAGQGRMLWYIDGRPVMKAQVPAGTRPLRDMTILLNVAMGGNVCAGKTPADGHYDMVVCALWMASELEYGGWGRFEHDWGNPQTPLGNTY